MMPASRPSSRASKKLIQVLDMFEALEVEAPKGTVRPKQRTLVR